MTDWGQKQPRILCAFIHCNIDFSQFLPLHLTPKFECRKVAGNYAILRGFENSDLGSFFQAFCTFSGNLSLFIETDGLFEKKQRVVFLETTRSSFYFKGRFSNYLQRYFYFLRENFYFVRENREKFEDSCKITWANDFELT